jgi:peptide/nickel transport system ATP-binding protein
MTAPILSIRSLSAVSELGNAQPILRNVSLDLSVGETLGLVGESGAGKSTIAKALLGVLPRTVRITQGATSEPCRGARRARSSATPSRSCRKTR